MICKGTSFSDEVSWLHQIEQNGGLRKTPQNRDHLPYKNQTHSTPWSQFKVKSKVFLKVPHPSQWGTCLSLLPGCGSEAGDQPQRGERSQTSQKKAKTQKLWAPITLMTLFRVWCPNLSYWPFSRHDSRNHPQQHSLFKWGGRQPWGRRSCFLLKGSWIESQQLT